MKYCLQEVGWDFNLGPMREQVLTMASSGRTNCEVIEPS